MSREASARTHEVRFYATLRRIVGAKCVDIPVPAQPTAQSILDAVVARFPDLGPELIGADGKLSRHVHIFLNGCLDDHFRGLPESSVDHFHSGITQGRSDDFDATVVTIETGLADQYSDSALAHVGIRGSWVP